MKYTPVGVDIAKHLIQVHFIDEHTGEVVDKQLRRQDFLTFFCNREPCLIGMEACVHINIMKIMGTVKAVPVGILRG